MTIANQLKAAENVPVVSTEAFPPGSRLTSRLKPIFVGPNGLRAGWRLLMFLALFAVLFGSFVLIKAGGPQGFQEKYRNAKPHYNHAACDGRVRSDHLAVSLRRCL
jgi:hypothetical protein